ncbi:Uncharacterised protein [Vibrio cholerae]|nr:Uncharacterised protein [Vibrio cholerae]
MNAQKPSLVMKTLMILFVPRMSSWSHGVISGWKSVTPNSSPYRKS